MKSDERIAIIFDGTKWYVRGIRVIEHDLTKDEKVYRCNTPLANALPTLAEVVAFVEKEGGPR